MFVGKKLRMSRIFDVETKTTIICPMDHGVEGFFPELEDVQPLIESISRAGVNAFLLRRGIARTAWTGFAGRSSLILRITSSSSLRNRPTEQTLVSSVKEGLRLGADAVASTIFVGADSEPLDARNLGMIADACEKWGMPFLGETMPIGGKESTPYDGPYTAEDVCLAARYGAEEGCDFIKTYYTGDPESFRKVVKYCPVPVVIAGGPPARTSKEVLEMVRGAIDAGAAGVAIGRKVWGSPNPAGLVRAMKKIIREKASLEEVLLELEKGKKT